MRLDHLLSKENSSIVGRHSSYPVRTTPSWCIGGSVEMAGQSQDLSSWHAGSTSFVFSSVLREPTQLGPRPRRPARSSRSRCPRSALHDPTLPMTCPSNGSTSGSHRVCGPVRCPLRTAEQARASLFFQATKSQRWMPWRQEPMKDVSDCEKLRGAVY